MVGARYGPPPCSWVPLAPESDDQLPGAEAGKRPGLESPEGGPCCEPGELFQNVIVLQFDLSAHARKKQWAKPSYSPPASVSARPDGSDGPAPPSPLRTLRFSEDTVRELFGAAGTSAWWGVSFEMGRAPSDPKFCASWRALFELLAPLERVSAPAYRHLLRARPAAVM